MSRYIVLLNAIKATVPNLPLTPSQLVCQARLQERLAYPGVANLSGPPGSGKTFLCWAMAASKKIAYVTHPCQLASTDFTSGSAVVVDNASADRSDFRRVVGQLETAGIRRAVIVTRHPANDYTFRVELALSNADLATVRRNLAVLGYQAADQEPSTLWLLLLQLVGVRR
jgi:hypothetical protein